MFNQTQLNSLALAAQDGCAAAEFELFRYFLPRIERISRSIRHLIDDEVSFEAYCLNLVKQAIRKFDSSKGNLNWAVDIRLRDARRHYLKNRSKQRRRQVSYEYLTDRTNADEETKSTIEFVDVLADIDSMAFQRENLEEKIALLAKGDQKKVTILKAWVLGYTNSEIAQLLAQLYGGNPESHRKTVTRFRKDCQTVLEKAA